MTLARVAAVVALLLLASVASAEIVRPTVSAPQPRPELPGMCTYYPAVDRWKCVVRLYPVMCRCPEVY